MNRRALALAFAVLALVQLAVPLRGILRYEAALRAGREYKFRVRPYDPADPFRGRYLALRLEPRSDVAAATCGRECWAAIVADPDGYARVTALSSARPPSGDAVRVRPFWSGASVATIILTADRYYLDEDRARAADRLVRNHEDEDDYARVRVRDGAAAIDGLVIDGTPL